MTIQEQTQFQYEFIPNIDGYEPKLMLGLTFVELTGAGLALVVPMLALQSGFGLLLGGLLAVVTILLLKRFERLGNLSLPLFLWKRFLLAYRPKTIGLSRLLSSVEATIKVSDYAGAHVATFN